VFKMDTSGTITTLYSFAGHPSDGEAPQQALFVNDADGMLYGNTSLGGTYDVGTVFRMDTSGGSYSFHEQTAIGGVCDPDGWAPLASFFKASDGNLYLPMSQCGNFGEQGTVDLVDPTRTESRTAGFYNLTGGPPTNIVNPTGHLVEGTDNDLYGTATTGAIASGYYGGVYRAPLGGGGPDLVHGFTGQDGLAPMAPLVLASDGFFYGTTFDITDAQGTAQNTGTIFKVDHNGNFQTVHVLHGVDGAQPITGMVQASDGNLYGAINGGGTKGVGVFYRLNLAGHYTVILDNADTIPFNYGLWSELVQGTDGKLYGTRLTAGNGDIFTIDLTQKVDSLTPNSGDAAGGEQITINGNGFATGATVNFMTKVTVPDATHIDGTVKQGDPGTLQDVQIVLPDETVIMAYKAWMYDFGDVPTGDIFHDYIRVILARGITAGTGGGNYGRNSPVLRQQMAVFLEKAMRGSDYVPPPCTGIFPDVPCSSPFAPWIEQLYADGITGGCAGGVNFCPTDPVLRQQMAVFLEKAKNGPSHVPPACQGIFQDVPCPSLFADFIEEIYNDGITGGCSGSPLLFCPGNSSTRGQMAVFIVKTFGF
jgi:uncharacterized repeat protein (TIGR03803 family)